MLQERALPVDSGESSLDRDGIAVRYRVGFFTETAADELAPIRYGCDLRKYEGPTACNRKRICETFDKE